MINVIVLQGRLTADPKPLSIGKSGAAKFSLASDQYGDKPAMFIDVTCWGKMSETVVAHLGKGSMVAVTGSLAFSTWTDAQGQPHKSFSINASNVAFLGTRPAAQRGEAVETPENDDVGIDDPFADQ